MNISRDIKPVTYLKARAADLLKQSTRPVDPWSLPRMGSPEPCCRTRELSEHANAIGLLKLISLGEEDIKDGKARSQEEVFATIENILKERTR